MIWHPVLLLVLLGAAPSSLEAEARRHTLLALEEAPRFRDAHALLAMLPPSPDLSSADGEPADSGAGGQAVRAPNNPAGNQ